MDSANGSREEIDRTDLLEVIQARWLSVDSWFTKPDVQHLYHYTTSKGLIGIVSTGELWLSDLRVMNDAEEHTYASERYVEIRDDLAGVVDDDVLGSLVAPVDGTLGSQCVFSTSAEPDAAPLWSMYARGAGFAIKFGAAELEAVMAWAHPRDDARRDAVIDAGMIRMVYEPAEQAVILVGLAEYRAECRAWLEKFTDPNLSKQIMDLQRRIEVAFESARKSMKRSGFRGEQEIRFLGRVRPDSDYWEYREGRDGMLIPFIRFVPRSPDRWPIEGVIAGPRSDPAAIESARRLLRQSGYDVPVERSKLRMR